MTTRQNIIKRQGNRIEVISVSKVGEPNKKLSPQSIKRQINNSLNKYHQRKQISPPKTNKKKLSTQNEEEIKIQRKQQNEIDFKKIIKNQDKYINQLQKKISNLQQKLSNTTIQVEDKKKNNLLQLFTVQMKKFTTKYPKLLQETDSKLRQYLQQLIDINEIEDKIEKQQKIQFHLRVLIKILLGEIQKVKIKTGVILEIDGSVIGMIKAEINNIINVEDILKVFRVVPKFVQVQKITGIIFERITQIAKEVPKIMQIEKYVEKLQNAQYTIEQLKSQINKYELHFKQLNDQTFRSNSKVDMKKSQKKFTILENAYLISIKNGKTYSASSQVFISNEIKENPQIINVKNKDNGLKLSNNLSINQLVTPTASGYQSYFSKYARNQIINIQKSSDKLNITNPKNTSADTKLSNVHGNINVIGNKPTSNYGNSPVNNNLSRPGTGYMSNSGTTSGVVYGTTYGSGYQYGTSVTGNGSGQITENNKRENSMTNKPINTPYGTNNLFGVNTGYQYTPSNRYNVNTNISSNTNTNKNTNKDLRGSNVSGTSSNGSGYSFSNRYGNTTPKY